MRTSGPAPLADTIPTSAAPPAARPRAARSLVAAVVTAGLVAVAAACSSPPSASPSASPGAPAAARGAAPAIEHLPLAWGDGLDHVVVYAEPTPSPRTGGWAGQRRPIGAGATVGAGATGTAGTAGTEATMAPSGARRIEVRLLDGSTLRVSVPRESLVVVFPNGDAEEERLRTSSASATLALIVLDVDGVVGPAGGRYLLVDDVLEQLPSLPPAEAASTGTSGGARSAPDVDAALVARLLAVDGVVSATVVAAGVIAVATAGAREGIAAVDGVAGLGDDTLLDLAADAREPEQWALHNTGAPEQAGGWEGVAGADTRAPRAWEVTEGAGVIVAVVDSGVDLDHPELRPRLWSNPADDCGDLVDDDADGRVDDCHGWDFGTGDADPNPDAGLPASGHGTHVAGIIAASRDGLGVAGIAPQATIMPLKVANSTGAIATSAVYGAVVYAVDHGADVVNISLATRPGTARAAVSALENAVVYARARGVTVVTGTGNDGVDITSRSRAVWPAGFSTMFDNVIAAAASTNADARASFSNFGDPTTAFAPGWWMLSTMPGGGHDFASGTSMSAAVVSGAAALVLAAGTAGTPPAVRARLVDTAAVAPAGYRIDAAAAVGIPPDPVIAVTYEGVDALTPDETGSLGIRVQATRMPAPVASVRLTLAAAVDHDVFAVEGVAATFTEPGGTTSPATSDAAGAFPPLAVLDPEALASTGWVLAADLALPRGDYAFVTELLDADGDALGGAQVAYVSIGGGLPVTSTTTGGAGVGATTLPDDAAGVVPTSAGASTTVPDATSTSDGAATDATGTTSVVGPSSSGDVSSTSVDATSATTSAGSTAPTSSTTDPDAAGSTTSPDPSSTAAPTTDAAASTTAAPTSTTATGAPTTTAAGGPATTTPAPDGDQEGMYAVTGMSPRWAPASGGTPLTITGTFPTSVPVYVWFGDEAIVSATSTGSTLMLVSPEVEGPMVTDVTVKFTLDTTYELTLEDAFTFGEALDGEPSTTTAPGSPPTTSAGATTSTSSTGSTGSTVATSTTAGAATSTDVPVTTAGGPSTTGSGPTSSTRPPSAGVRLRPVPADGPVASLSTAAWPRPGCAGSSCSAGAL